jgi:hypothetical protein
MTVSLAGALLLVSSALAVPEGNGLITTPAIVSCDGGTIHAVLVLRGAGATSWNLSTGEHVVIQEFSVTTTFTPIGGGTPITETTTKTFGHKTGLGPAHHCSTPFSETIPDVGTITGVATAISFTVPKD